MNRQDLMDWINAMEQKYPVEEWKIDGFHIWPIIRVKLMFYLISQVENNGFSRNSSDNDKKTILDRAIEKFKWIINSIRFLITAKNIDVIFIGAFVHRVKYKNSWYNRFFDPVIEDLEESNYNCLRMEYGRYSSSKQLPLYQEEKIVFLEQIIYLFIIYENIIGKLKFSKNRNLNQFDNFLKELEVVPIIKKLKNKLSYVQLQKELKTTSAYRRFFEFYLRKSKPRAIIALCYYSLPIYGVIAAAYKLGVPFIDLQHGPHADLHAAYGKFSKVPLQGFNTLPKIFWVWDENTGRTLYKWIRNQKFHMVRRCGHPWVQYWKKKRMNYIDSDRPYILYSLQPIGELLEDYVLEAIKSSVDKYNWCLRLHPRQQYALNDLTKIFEKAGIADKVELDNGMENHLPEVLIRTSIHLTRFSGVALEAAMFNVPTIFLDRLATQYYNFLINTGKATYIDSENKNELLNAIKEYLKVKKSEVYCDENKEENDNSFLDIVSCI